MQSDTERDELVMTLVESALSQPADSSPSFLSRVGAQHPEVSDEVRERVEWELRMQSFLREPIIQRQRNVPAFASSDLIGGRFRIRRAIGEGGMGSVYEGVRHTPRPLCCHQAAHFGFSRTLTPEARAALEVSHVSVCKLHELHTAETQSGAVDFLTMEFIDGETLYQRIAREGPLGHKEALEIARQICAGVRQAHTQGVVHGDLKSPIFSSRRTIGPSLPTLALPRSSQARTRPQPRAARRITWPPNSTPGIRPAWLRMSTHWVFSFVF